MKKALLLIFAVTLLAACKSERQQERETGKWKTISGYIEYTNSTINGHLYIVTSRGGIFHDQSCKNH